MAGDGSVVDHVVIPYAGLRPRQPVWVKIGLWGLSGRGSAWAFFWGCVVVAVGCVIAGFLHHPGWFFGASLLLAAFWYWASIRWVDRHGGWSQVRG